jgi:zinc transporter ZupT
MSIVLLKALFALLILSVTILAAVYPFKKKIKEGQSYDFPIGESLACGVFLGAALLHMLSESALTFTHLGIHYPLAYLLAGSLFLIFLWLEHVGRECYAHQKKESPYFVLIAVLMLSIHSILAGAALGLSDDYSVTVILFIAIIAHKWAESFALAVYVNKSSLTKKMRYLCFLFFTVMAPLGIFLGAGIISYLPKHSLLPPIFTSLAAGTFLYLGTLHGLDKGVLIKQCCNLKHFSFVIIGFGIMAIVAIYT